MNRGDSGIPLFFVRAAFFDFGDELFGAGLHFFILGLERLLESIESGDAEFAKSRHRLFAPVELLAAEVLDVVAQLGRDQSVLQKGKAYPHELGRRDDKFSVRGDDRELL